MPVIGSRALKLKVGATDYTAEVSKVRIKVAKTDSEFVSFADAAAGGAKDYVLAITLRQDTAAASLWYYAWSQSGADVAVEVWPNGGTVPSTTNPKFTGTVTVAPPDGDLLGGDANESNAVKYVTELEWKFIAKPTLVIA